MMNHWQGMLAPKGLSYDESGLTPTEGTFWIEPLEEGYGVTIGNSLRRVLLSSLVGAAIYRIRVEGIEHEFTAVPGVKEDATELILNLKGVVVHYEGDEVQILRLQKSDAGPVVAGDIEAPEGVEIVNKDHYLCYLDHGSLNIELQVNVGRGYVSSKKNYEEDLPIGIIPIDSLYSPVLKVKYDIEKLPSEPEREPEKLNLHVTTNGTISPLDAVIAASKVLQDHYALLIGDKELSVMTPTEEDTGEENKGDDQLDMKIEELELTVRALNCLTQAGIQTVGDLTDKTEDEVMKTPHLGKKSLAEIKEKLENLGLSLKEGE